MFMRRLPVGSVEVRWDGKALTVPEGTWQGVRTLVSPTQQPGA